MNKQPLVVNLWGGPGCGKSTLAAELFVTLKKSNIEVALVNEYAQELIHEDRHMVLETDQLYVTAKQQRKIKRLKNVDVIITDSPLLMAEAYFQEDKNGYSKEVFSELLKGLNNSFNNIHFYLERDDDYEFSPVGRTQTTIEEAKLKDNEILSIMMKLDNYYNLPAVDTFYKLDIICSHIPQCNTGEYYV